MALPRILHLETATNICSVALSEGEEILCTRESSEERSHGSLLAVFMSELMQEACVSPEEINAISVSKGPGSYTGLRIGVSTTKGFAYAQNIPVIGIMTLHAMAVAALDNEEVKKLISMDKELLLCPLIDARRMEVYSALYNLNTEVVQPVAATIIDEKSFAAHLNSKNVLFFGNGSDKISETLIHPNAHFIKGIVPSARYMVHLALKAFREKSFEDTAYFEPFYLKDFITTIPKNKIF